MNQKELDRGTSINQSESIVLEREPLIYLMFALPFLVVGLFLMALPWVASNRDAIALPVKALLFAVGLIMNLVPIHSFKSGLKEVIVDPIRGKVFVRKRYYGTVVSSFDGSEIVDIVVETDTDAEGDIFYRLTTRLNSGETTKLTKKCFKQNSDAEQERKWQLGVIRGEKDQALLRPQELKPQATQASADTTRNFLTGTILVTAIVCIAPFAGWWLAAQEKPDPQMHVVAGKPTQVVAAMIRAKAQGKLAADEPVLFVASPEPGHEGMAKIWLIPFAIFWTLFSLFWVSCAVWGTVRNRSPITALMTLFGLPFLGIGVVLLALPYTCYKQDLHTVYAITDKRALAIANDGAKTIVRFNQDNFKEILINHYSPTRADLLFYHDLNKENPGTTSGFWGIEKGEEARALLQAVLAQKLGKDGLILKKQATDLQHRK